MRAYGSRKRGAGNSRREGNRCACVCEWCMHLVKERRGREKKKFVGVGVYGLKEVCKSE
jgi:hypothetical protein